MAIEETSGEMNMNSNCDRKLMNQFKFSTACCKFDLCK